MLLELLTAVTIIIDNRNICGSGRIAEYNRQVAEDTAQKEARRLRAEGKKVKIIRLENGSVSTQTTDVRIPTC